MSSTDLRYAVRNPDGSAGETGRTTNPMFNAFSVVEVALNVARRSQVGATVTLRAGRRVWRYQIVSINWPAIRRVTKDGHCYHCKQAHRPDGDHNDC